MISVIYLFFCTYSEISLAQVCLLAVSDKLLFVFLFDASPKMLDALVGDCGS